MHTGAVVMHTGAVVMHTGAVVMQSKCFDLVENFEFHNVKELLKETSY